MMRVGVVPGVAPAPDRRRAHDHEAGELVQPVVHPPRPERRAVARLVPARVRRRAVQDAVAEQQRDPHEVAGQERPRAQPTEQRQQGEPQQRVADRRAVAALHQLLHPGPLDRWLVPPRSGEPGRPRGGALRAEQPVVTLDHGGAHLCSFVVHHGPIADAMPGLSGLARPARAGKTVELMAQAPDLELLTVGRISVDLYAEQLGTHFTTCARSASRSAARRPTSRSPPAGSAIVPPCSRGSATTRWAATSGTPCPTRSASTLARRHRSCAANAGRVRDHGRPRRAGHRLLPRPAGTGHDDRLRRHRPRGCREGPDPLVPGIVPVRRTEPLDAPRPARVAGATPSHRARPRLASAVLVERRRGDPADQPRARRCDDRHRQPRSSARSRSASPTPIAPPTRSSTAGSAPPSSNSVATVCSSPPQTVSANGSHRSPSRSCAASEREMPSAARSATACWPDGTYRPRPASATPPARSSPRA